MAHSTRASSLRRDLDARRQARRKTWRPGARSAIELLRLVGLKPEASPGSRMNSRAASVSASAWARARHEPRGRLRR